MNVHPTYMVCPDYLVLATHLVLATAEAVRHDSVHLVELKLWKIHAKT